MELLLPHQYLLLELDDGTGMSRVQDSFLRSHGLAGAFLAELELQGRWSSVWAHRFVVRPSPQPVPGALGDAAARLVGRKPMKIGTAIARLSRFSRALRRSLAAELVELGALREQQDKLWIVPYRTRFPTGDGAVEQSVREHLRTWLAEVPVDAGPQREDLLLSLLRCTRILDSVWSESELETLRPQIDKRTEMSPIGKEVKRSADQTRAAVAASIAAGT